MESNLVAEFVAQTGVSSLEAHNKLQARGWDLKLAIQDYANEGKENKSRAIVTKSDEDGSYKKLTRGISRATDNACVVSKARLELGLDVRENSSCDGDQYLIHAPIYSFTLPELTNDESEFTKFLKRDLIEMSCLNSLEEAGRLNWWKNIKNCQLLWPLYTTGDGNCLLHAASLGMWGFHDRKLTLRKALYELLTTSSYKLALWRRWRWQLTLLNAEAGLVYTEEEWRREWEAIVNMASTTPRNNGRRRSMLADKTGVPENATYESLEEIHVLALAHVLKRTIIIIADTMLKDTEGENLAPILFGGIYLPLEIAPGKCHKCPLVLSYDAAHFSALVTMDSSQHSPNLNPVVLPLTDSEYKLLPLQFVVDPGSQFVWGRDEVVPGVGERLQPSQKEQIAKLREYLEVILVPLSLTPSSEEYEDMDTPADEEDIEKRFTEADVGDLNEDQTDSAALFARNSRAARQFQTVAKSFGSIGKSVSKKLKKNLAPTKNKMTKGVEKRENGGIGKPEYLISARLGIENRPKYMDEMVSNYLTTARARFERERESKSGTRSGMESSKPCITQGCNMFASSETSYLCSACYDKHRNQQIVNQSYETGKSTFYVEPSQTGSSVGATDPVMLRNKKYEEPPPLQINRSTFYSDRMYPNDWVSSASRSTAPVPLRRSTLQEVGNAIDGLGPGRYTPAHRNRETDSGSQRTLHSYNLSRELTPPSSSEGTVYCVKGTSGIRMSPQNSTLTTLTPQSSQDLPQIENVHPAERDLRVTRTQPVTRIIPVMVESSSRRCLNVTCPFYGSSELDNYCSKCYKGRRQTLSFSRSVN